LKKECQRLQDALEKDRQVWETERDLQKAELAQARGQIDAQLIEKEKALAKQHEAAAQGLTAERDTLTARLAEAEAAVEATYQARLKSLPKEAKNAIESLPGLSVPQRLAWLDANAGLFARPTPPNINATDQGTTGTTKQDQTDLWRRWGLTHAVRAAQQQDK
jgi:hypothetical protein